METYLTVNFIINCIGIVVYFISIIKGELTTEVNNYICLIISVIFAAWAGTILF